MENYFVSALYTLGFGGCRVAASFNNWLQAQSLRSLDKFFHYGFAFVPKFAPEPKRYIPRREI